MRYKTLVFFLVSIHLFFITDAAEPAARYTVIEDRAKLPILSPDLSERKVMKLRLSNGLEAYLVSDPKLDQSGAVLSVDAGSWEDPAEYPGLAHFLEHMLFLGTKKYPEESAYHRYITENGGSANAYTTHNYTSFMFAINNPAFEQALDRFSSFFIEPLFNPSGVSRELQAIDQEYAKNLENDDWRLLYVDKAVSDPKHPYHNFHIGNSKTLSQVSQETLKKWYRDHYSANLMHLVVYSNLPLEKLKNLVVADFSDIPASDKKALDMQVPLYSDAYKEQMIYIEPVKDTRSLSLIWNLPAQFSEMKETQPYSVICYVLGHEGQESLLAQLKREDLAEGLQCGKIKLGRHSMEFVLEIELTDKGVQHVDKVIERVFQTIANFKEKGAPEYIFEEIQQMQKINYEYQSHEDVFTQMMKQADWITDEPLNSYPEHTLIIQKFDPDGVKALLNQLKVENAHYYLVAPPKLLDHALDRVEPWLGTHYGIEKIDVKWLDKWKNAAANPKIDLPAPNPFIPKNLSIIKKDQTKNKEQTFIPRPEIVLDNSKGKIYFSDDNRYRLPKVYWEFDLKTPMVDMGICSKVVLADLFVRSIQESLSNTSYEAGLAGLNYGIKGSNYGISFTIEGFDEKAILLFEVILRALKELKITQEQFDIYKASLERDYSNFSKQMPIEQAIQVFKSLIYQSYTTDKQKALAIKKITYEKFNEYVAQLFEKFYVEGLMYGNLSHEEAVKVANKIFQVLQGKPYAKGKDKKPAVITMSNDQGPVFMKSSTKAQGSSAILAIQQPTFSFKARAMQQLLMQAIKEPFFSTLRTKQQTGYIVISEGKEIQKQLFDLFAVQSNTHDTRDLLARFELFIEGFIQEINVEIPKERFIQLQLSLLESLLQPPKNISAMGMLLYKLGFDYEGDFDWMTKRIQGMRDLSYREFLQMTDEVLGRSNHRRLGILLKGAPSDQEFSYKEVSTPTALRKSSKYTQ